MSVVALWSMKGGVGVSVLTAALAISAHRSGPESVASAIAVDLAGDLPVVLGMSADETLGVVDWLRAAPDDPTDALRRLAVEPADSTASGLGIVPRGAGGIEIDDPAAAADRLVDALRPAADLAFVDCGHFRPPGPFPQGASEPSVDQEFRVAVAAAADVGWLVTRACYLSASVASHSPVDADGCVVLREAGRALTSADVADALAVPLVLDIAIDRRIARIVDCGSLTTRLPSSLQRTMARSLRHVA